MDTKKRSPYVLFFGSIFFIFYFTYIYNVTPKVTKTHRQRIQTTSHSQVIPEERSAPSTAISYQNPIILTEVTWIPKSSESLTSFASVLSTFDWNGYEAIMSKWNPEERSSKALVKIEEYHEQLMILLTPFLEKEPLVPINASCMAPLFIPPPDLNCSGHGNAFTGSLRSTVPKIGILVQFGFEVDVLEIYLNEVYDVIDQFFIVESTKAHFRTLEKALLWENVKNQPRFKKFTDKITHFIIDDADTAKTKEMLLDSGTGAWAVNFETWRMENLQEKLRWTKFLNWNGAHDFFSLDDLIGFGDSDEIPSRETLYMMKHCELMAERIDIGIWFPFGNIRQAFATDYPVPGHPFTLGDPTFWTLRSAIQYYMGIGHKTPGRMRGTSNQFLLGGIHMTHYGYSPYRIMRDISCSECSAYSAPQIRALAQQIGEQDIRQLEVQLRELGNQTKERIVDLDSIAEIMKEIAILPWFYDCNRDRYPVWDGGHDTRLD